MSGCLGDLVRVVEKFEVHARNLNYGCLDLAINCCQKEIIMKRAPLSAENFGALIILYSKIGGHMLTPFLDTSGKLIKLGSAD